MTDWDGFQARVHPGEGIIARSSGGALVLPTPSANQQTVDQLLALVRDAQPGGGRTLARKLAGILASAEGDDSIDLALLAPLSGGDIAVLVVGDVDVSADGAEGPLRVTGRDSLTWVDKVLRAPTHIQITGGSSSGGSVAVSDLVAGIVPGSGLSLAPRGDGPAISAPSKPASTAAEDKPSADLREARGRRRTTPAPARLPPPPPPPPPPPAPPAPPLPPVPDFQVEPLTGGGGQSRDPLPVAEEEGLVPPPGAGHALVKGVYCKRGHFNDPMVQFCTVCGINMVQQTPALVDGPRPPLGVLVFDDGSVFQLEDDYVLGRQPEGAPEVIVGRGSCAAAR